VLFKELTLVVNPATIFASAAPIFALATAFASPKFCSVSYLTTPLADAAAAYAASAIAASTVVGSQ
jgi:hypothetical protein